jgi:cellulose biosynthesis protein BcsQ
VWGTAGLIKFIRSIDEQREDEIITAEMLGLLATMVQARTRIGRDIVDDMHASPYPAFTTSIPRRIGADDAVADHLVAGESGVDRAFSAAYLAFAEEVRTMLAQARRGAHRAD